MSFNRCVGLHNHHHHQDTGQFHHLKRKKKENLGLLLCKTLLPTPEPRSCSSVSIPTFLPFPEGDKNGILQNMTFKRASFSQHHVCEIHPGCLHCRSPLLLAGQCSVVYVYHSVFSPSLLMDIWATPSLGYCK